MSYFKTREVCRELQRIDWQTVGSRPFAGGGMQSGTFGQGMRPITPAAAPVGMSSTRRGPADLLKSAAMTINRSVDPVQTDTVKRGDPSAQSRTPQGGGAAAPAAGPAFTTPNPLHTGQDELALVFEDVAVGYGDTTILSGINVRVKRGQVVTFMGGSGTGKTTLLRAATGQLQAQRGAVRVFGENIATASPERLQGMRRRMGVLFQQGALFTDLDVFENVAFPLREHSDFDEATIREKVLDKLDAVGLRAAAHLRPSEISGGMARRVALARAVALDPDLVLYDEPFAGLDPISMGVTAQLIRTLSDRLGCASVMITHDVADSFAISDYIYLIGQGTFKAEGTPAEMRASQDPFVRQFLNGEPDGPVAFHYQETPAFVAWLARQQGETPVVEERK